MRATINTPETLERRFRERFTVGAPDECWLWQGKKLPTGYGMIRITREKQAYAHRLAYELNHGPIPKGLFICHACDVPGCVNPAHLWAGTPKENTHDMIRKGRNICVPSPGEANSNAILTDDDVRLIRLYRLDGESCESLAILCGVDVGTISVAANGKCWKHITDVPPVPLRSVNSAARILELNGERLSAAKWAKRYGMPRSRLYKRIDAGWSVAKAVLSPRVQRAA